MRHLSLLKTNSLLFNLAVNEKFTNRELEELAEFFMVTASLLKYKFIKNKNQFSSKDFDEVIVNFSSNKMSWTSHLKINSLKALKHYILLNFNVNIYFFLINIKGILDSFKEYSSK